MHSVVHNLSNAAQAADQELRQAGQRPDKLGDCGDQLRKCFSVSLQAPGMRTCGAGRVAAVAFQVVRYCVLDSAVHITVCASAALSVQAHKPLPCLSCILPIGNQDNTWWSWAL